MVLSNSGMMKYCRKHWIICKSLAIIQNRKKSSSVMLASEQRRVTACSSGTVAWISGLPKFAQKISKEQPFQAVFQEILKNGGLFR